MTLNLFSIELHGEGENAQDCCSGWRQRYYVICWGCYNEREFQENWLGWPFSRNILNNYQLIYHFKIYWDGLIFNFRLINWHWIQDHTRMGTEAALRPLGYELDVAIQITSLNIIWIKNRLWLRMISVKETLKKRSWRVRSMQLFLVVALYPARSTRSSRATSRILNASVTS